jgi:hypothetical protein
MITQRDLARAAAVTREVDLTTFGRESGRASRRTIWITSGASGRIHIRSGQGLARDWPRNLLANPRAVLHINGKDIAVRARHSRASGERPTGTLRRANKLLPLANPQRYNVPLWRLRTPMPSRS